MLESYPEPFAGDAQSPSPVGAEETSCFFVSLPFVFLRELVYGVPSYVFRS